jgi:hypothetical protein
LVLLNSPVSLGIWRDKVLSPVGQAVLEILLGSGAERDNTEHLRKTAKFHVLRAMKQKYVYFDSISIGALGSLHIGQKQQLHNYICMICLRGTSAK